jgi:uncharacterized phage-associated protein
MKIEREINQVSAIQLSEYILKNNGPISHLKLQKLLYYCDAYHLAYFDSPLVHENFEAWVHGPVCVEVYNTLKGKSVLYSDVAYDPASAKVDPDTFINESLSSKQVELIKDILASLGSWKDSELEAATHREKPWLEARAGIHPAQKHNGVISKVTMMEFYKNEILK